MTEWMVERERGYGASGGRPAALYTWVYRVLRTVRGVERREYLAGTAGRIKASEAQSVADALNEWSLTTGEGR
jgi:hypothetical protein